MDAEVLNEWPDVQPGSLDFSMLQPEVVLHVPEPQPLAAPNPDALSQIVNSVILSSEQAVECPAPATRTLPPGMQAPLTGPLPSVPLCRTPVVSDKTVSGRACMSSVTTINVARQTPMLRMSIPFDDPSLPLKEYATLVVSAIGGRLADYVNGLRENVKESEARARESAESIASMKRRIKELLAGDTPSSDSVSVRSGPSCSNSSCEKRKRMNFVESDFPARFTTCSAPREDGVPCLWIERVGKSEDGKKQGKNGGYHSRTQHPNLPHSRAYYEKKVMISSLKEFNERMCNWKTQKISRQSKKQGRRVEC